MRMSQRRKPGLFRRWFFRYFPATAWYLMRDLPENKVKIDYSKIDDPLSFDQAKELTWICVMSGLTVLGSMGLVFGVLWFISETVKQLMLVE